MRNGLKARCHVGDMNRPCLRGMKFDGAYCTVDTFRHLLTDRDAFSHLRFVNQALTGNGIYILGLHVLPRRGIRNKAFRWQGGRGKLQVHTTIKVLDVDTRRREETLAYILRVRKPSVTLNYRSVYKLRTYSLNQFKEIVDSGGFEIREIYDVEGGYTGPITPGADSENLAFVLGKKQVIQ